VSPRRTVIIIVAIVIAALAALTNVLYLHSVQDRANNHAKQLPVYIITRTIPKGTGGETALANAWVKKSSIPERFKPASAVQDINSIRGKVALNDLAAGQIVVDGQFVEPKVAQVTFSQRIPPGQVTVTLSFDAIHSVNNFLVAGDKVDMIVPCDPTKPVPAAAGSVTPQGQEAFFWQNVTILAIGASAAPQAGETQAVSNPGGGSITFALPPVAAERLLLATGGGVAANSTTGCGSGVYLSLVPPDNTPANIPPMDPSQFWAGGLTPYQ